MTAAQWLAAARASGMSVYLHPDKPRAKRFCMSLPVAVPGIADPRPFHPERWPEIDAALEDIGHAAVLAALKKEEARRHAIFTRRRRRMEAHLKEAIRALRRAEDAFHVPRGYIGGYLTASARRRKTTADAS